MKKRTLPLLISAIILPGLISILIQYLLFSANIGTSPNFAEGCLYFASLLLLLIILIVEIVSVFKIDDSTIHTVFLAVCLLGLYLFSTDMQLFLRNFDIYIPEIVFGLLSETFFVLVSFCCIEYIMYLNRLSNFKNWLRLSFLISFLFVPIYTISSYFNYGYIVHFIIAVMLVLDFCAVFYNSRKKGDLTLTAYFTTVVFCLGLGVQNINTLSYNGPFESVIGFSLTYASLSDLMFIIVYLLFSIRTDKKAVQSNVYKLQAELYEKKFLSEQIKPHFIFNSLESIRELYHESLALGDKGINLFANFLRGNLNSFDDNLIPFETELNNVFSYAELRNLGKKDPIEIIYDIDYTDFKVPPFSIQPFVENALKYSGIEKKDNGYIIISTYKRNGKVFIEINDNGKGFDVNKVFSNSHGIKNACERFSLLLGVDPTIKSVIGKGTSIQIILSTDKTEVEDENSSN